MNNQNTEDRKRVVDVLNDLMEINYDGSHGYRTAADAIDNSDYQALFREYAEQRKQFVDELRAVISRFHGQPEDEGNLGGVFHRAWIDIKAAVTNGDAAAIMAECDRSEEAALDAYQDAMAKDLPEGVRDIIRHQMSAIRLAHERVHALHTALRHKKERE
ncbi:MAG TPA: PA2169 family four-helix-bundle protein [Anaerolineae bacterium]